MLPVPLAAGPGGPEESGEGAGVSQRVVRPGGPAEVAAADARGGGAVLQHQEAERREAAAGGQGGGEPCPSAALHPGPRPVLPATLLPRRCLSRSEPSGCGLLFLPLMLQLLIMSSSPRRRGCGWGSLAPAFREASGGRWQDGPAGPGRPGGRILLGPGYGRGLPLLVSFPLSSAFSYLFLLPFPFSSPFSCAA